MPVKTTPSKKKKKKNAYKKNVKNKVPIVMDIPPLLLPKKDE